MRYVIARCNQHQRDWAYRIYVTEGLRHLAGLNIRFLDLFSPKETKTAEEVITGIREKFKE